MNEKDRTRTEGDPRGSARSFRAAALRVPASADDGAPALRRPGLAPGLGMTGGPT